ncbi:MAG: Periplasmic binding protein domain protein [Gemmatimonadetes bacterium]|nr:Periplasmic binding protein domain protein [Gemmatimonadota bacterium]
MQGRRAGWGRVVMAGLCATALACSGGARDKTATPADSTNKAVAKNGKTITLAMIAKESANPVFLAARTGAEAAARELSAKYGVDVKVQWLTPPQQDGEVQAQRVRQALNEGVDGILISASDAGKVTGAINDAVDRGVPVMTFDSDAPQSKRFAFYGVDDEKTGRETMAELAKVLNGKGNVAVLAGNQNAPNLQRRVQGVKTEAAKYPGIKIVGVFNHIETPQDASAEVVRVNNAYPEITGWAFIGGWPLWTQSLLTDINPAKIKVTSVDALPSQLVYVEKGIVPVLLAQSVYLWGHQGIETLFEKVHDNKVPANPIMPMELVRVTKDNLGDWARQLKEWGFTDVDPKYLALPPASKK